MVLKRPCFGTAAKVAISSKKMSQYFNVSCQIIIVFLLVVFLGVFTNLGAICFCALNAREYDIREDITLY